MVAPVYSPGVVTIPCINCGHVYIFPVDHKGFMAYLSGVLIQKALPDLSPDHRELLISQICGKCFDEITRNYD